VTMVAITKPGRYEDGDGSGDDSIVAVVIIRLEIVHLCMYTHAHTQT
jgi:hypothetical protein